MKKCRSAIALILALSATCSALAAPAPVYEDGILTGFSFIELDGMPYDVTFVDGSCIGLLDGCEEQTDFPFATSEEAHEASQALADALNERGISYQDDVAGCTGACSLLTPISRSQSDETRVTLVDLWLSNTAIPSGQESLLRTSDTSNHDDMVYALWAPTEEDSSSFILKLVPAILERQ